MPLVVELYGHQVIPRVRELSSRRPRYGKSSMTVSMAARPQLS
jgi:hypothetical protein